MTIWRMRIACWIPKATHTYLEYVMLTAFPLQQMLHERASILRYTYIGCLAISIFLLRAFLSVLCQNLKHAQYKQYNENKKNHCTSTCPVHCCITHTVISYTEDKSTVQCQQSNIKLPRLTKIIRSGITFVSRNVISRRFL